MPFGMGFGELVLILIIVVVVFGATKLPQLGDGLGKAIKNFKRAVNAQNEIDVSPQAKSRRQDVGSVDDDAGKVGKRSVVGRVDVLGRRIASPGAAARRRIRHVARRFARDA